MTIRLGENQYGKAETHMVRVTKGGRDGSVHEIKDLNVSVALVGDFAASHLTGDNSNIVPTDTQKNTVFAFAKEKQVYLVGCLPEVDGDQLFDTAVLVGPDGFVGK